MTNITKAAQQAIAEFDRYFTSANGVDVPERVTVSRDEWRALRAALQDKAGEVPADGWLQDGGLLYRLTDESRPQNRDEINVTMADGSRSPESRARRAGELLDRIRSAHPAPVVPDDHPLMVFAKECRLGAYTDHEVIQEAGKALAASQQKGRQ